MEVKILKGEKNQFNFELDSIDHTLCNALKMELWENKNIKVAGYKITHPLVQKTTFFIEMKSGDGRKAVEEALASLKKKFESLKAAKL